MMLFTLIALAAMILPSVLFDQYLLSLCERFREQNRNEMSRFHALLA